MTRIVRWMIRGGLLSLLALAYVDPPLPGAGPRTRVYLIDVSASARKTTGSESFTPDDALRLATHDLASLKPDDQVALVVFASKPSILVPLTPASKASFNVKLEGVEGSSTDLAAALETARALAGGGEIVLFSDGRPTTGRVPVERIRVPVHVFPLGPLGGVDASIAAIDAPASAAPGSRVQVRVTVESTGPWQGELVAGEERRRLEFSGPGRQDAVFTLAAPVETQLRLAGPGDLCLENDSSPLVVHAESETPRILVVSPLRPDLASANESDVVILQGVRADAFSRADLDRLARLVREEGVGLVMTGGSAAFALGGWNGTPVEDLLPFWAFPDERSAVVVALDRSGSMNEPAPGRSRPRIEEAASAILRAFQAMHDDDEAALVTFAESPQLRCPLVSGWDRGKAAGALQGIVAGGPTVLSEALTLAAATVKTSKSGRRQILLVTDGRSVGEEDKLRSAAKILREDGIGLTIVRIGESSTSALGILREAGAREIDGSDFGLLEATIGEALARSRDLTLIPTHPLSLPGLPSNSLPALLNRVSLKPGAEILGRSGDTPVAAVRPAGRGRVAASTFSFEPGWTEGLSWLASKVSPQSRRLPADVSLRFEDERLEITASLRGPERPDTFEVTVDGAPVVLARRGENTYFGALKSPSGNASVRNGGRIAAVARRPHAPEFDRVGPDLELLDEIEKATGGTRLTAPRDLASLPGRGSPQPRSSRTLLLVAALALFLFDVALGLLPRRPGVR